MENSHLVVILQSLDKKEIRELRKWLQSPAHNLREDVLELFDYLLNGKRLENPHSLQKEKVFKKIFPGEAYDDAKLRQSMHFLLKAVEEFLTYEELKRDEVRSKVALASVYRARSLEKPYNKTIRSVDELQENSPYRHDQFLLNQYIIQQEKYANLERQKRNVPYNLQEVSDALDNTYIANKLRQSCLILAHQKMYRMEYEIGLLDEVLQYVEEKDIFHVPAIAVYYFGYRAFTAKEGETHFINLRKAITQYGHLFPISEIRDIYLMAINYCIKKLNEGSRPYLQESLNLYKEGFAKGFLIENNFISHVTFNNVVAIAIRLKEYNWTKHFIEDYQSYLIDKFRDNTVDFCRARLYIEQKDFKKAMPLLAQVDFDDIVITLSAKSMLLKMYYELNEEDALDALLESMRTYINRKEVLGYHKFNYQNIIRLTRKLVRLNPFDKKQREKLHKEIAETNPLTEREWLMQQLGAL